MGGNVNMRSKTKKMEWSNLRENKCPACGKEFGWMAFQTANVIICPNTKCDFKISHRRYTEIVSSQVTKTLGGGEDNG